MPFPLFFFRFTLWRNTSCPNPTRYKWRDSRYIGSEGNYRGEGSGSADVLGGCASKPGLEISRCARRSPHPQPTATMQVSAWEGFWPSRQTPSPTHFVPCVVPALGKCSVGPRHPPYNSAGLAKTLIAVSFRALAPPGSPSSLARPRYAVLIWPHATLVLKTDRSSLGLAKYPAYGPGRATFWATCILHVSYFTPVGLGAQSIAVAIPGAWPALERLCHSPGRANESTGPYITEARRCSTSWHR